MTTPRACDAVTEHQRRTVGLREQFRRERHYLRVSLRCGPDMVSQSEVESVCACITPTGDDGRINLVNEDGTALTGR